MFAGRTGRDREHRDPSQGCAEANCDSSSGALLRPCDPRPRLRNNFPCRTEGESQFLPSDDDPTGTRLHSGRQRVDRIVQRERQGPSLNLPPLGFLLLLTILACNSQTPQFAFDRANRAFLHGDLSAAQEQAEKGYRDFHGLGPDWAWRFRILEANVLMWRGLSQQVQPLLLSEATPTPAGDLTIHRRRLEALVYVYEHRFQEAESELHEAERSCTTFRDSPCAEVISAWGGLEMERGHFVEAQRRFEQTLPLFRDDGFLE